MSKMGNSKTPRQGLKRKKRGEFESAELPLGEKSVIGIAPHEREKERIYNGQRVLATHMVKKKKKESPGKLVQLRRVKGRKLNEKTENPSRHYEGARNQQGQKKWVSEG